jgi:zinc transporter ZupT
VDGNVYCPPMVKRSQEQRQNSGSYTLLGLLMLVVAGAVLVVAVRAVFSLLASASPAVLAAVVVTSGTILVSVASLILSNRYRVRQQI